MAPFKVFVTRQIHDDGINLLKKHYSVDVWDSQEALPKPEMMKKVKGYDAILCMISDVMDKDVINAAGPQLKMISTMSSGMHHIDVKECKAKDIQVINTPDVCIDSAAEMSTLLLLVAARRCFEGQRAVTNGEWGLWKPMWLCGTELSQRTLGILGFGRVGLGVARRLKPFGLNRIMYSDIRPLAVAQGLGAEFVDKKTLYKESDFLVITCPLTAATHKMINKSIFDQMKKGAIFVNTSRGQIVETDDLVEALRSGHLTAAALDVTDPQPLPPDHPLVKMDNCIITPHMGTNTVQARKAMAINAAENVVAILKRC